MRTRAAARPEGLDRDFIRCTVIPPPNAHVGDWTGVVDFLRQCVLAAGCLAASVAPLLAQGAGGRISGTVTDQTGAAVAGATVTVTNVETNRRRSVSSSRDGMYTAASLAPGDYRVEVERSGFKSVRRDAVRVAAGERARIDVELPVGDLSEQVTITAGAPLLRTDTASLDMPHVFVSSVVWDLPAGAGRVRQLHGIVGALANDWTVASLVTLQSGMPIAVTQATNFNAFAASACSGHISSATRHCRPIDGRRAAGSILRRLPSRRSSPSAQHRATLCAGRRLATSISRSCAGSLLAPHRFSRYEEKCSTS
jgi:hypothetical protein